MKSHRSPLTAIFVAILAALPQPAPAQEEAVPLFNGTDPDAPLMPDYDRTRRERLSVMGGRFRTPAGFTVEEVATDELIGSTIKLTFDPLGRPTLSSEQGGILILLDEDGDGIYEAKKSFSDEVTTAMGMHYLGPGDLLVNANGPRGAALYRLRDTDGDDEADEVELIKRSQGGIGEHGPHTILTGPDGYLYVLYGNHAHPRGDLLPGSPSRGLQEDHLLPRYLDPRGHANRIRVPAGTMHRVSPDLQTWARLVSGFRNPYDMTMDLSGEIFAFEADMEWDFRLPWYRPIRVVHAIPGGDYGWRTGSSKMPFYYIDTLPSVDDVGRGSPVGVAFYYHNVYPERFHGALFMGDWTRGRVRVIFPRRAGATYEGKTLDFVLGEPLNITDLAIGPDGFLYFITGGRGTHGGLYRVRYDGPSKPPEATSPIEALLDQPMPRSAWGKERLRQAKKEMRSRWALGLRNATVDPAVSTERRLRALEALQVHGPKPGMRRLELLAKDADPEIRAAALFLLGTHPLRQVRDLLSAALNDEDPFVVRRACEALVRAGLDLDASGRGLRQLAQRLVTLLEHEDRFVRYAARMALIRIPRGVWTHWVMADSIVVRPNGANEGVLALVYTQQTAADSMQIFTKLSEFARFEMTDETLLDYLRVVQLALIRSQATEGIREVFSRSLGPLLLARFPRADPRVNRELQVVLAQLQTPGAVAALLDYLGPDKPQEEQIHTVYALRAIEKGWTRKQRNQLVEWFDRGRELRGAASMEGYIDNLWASFMDLLPKKERVAAEARKAQALRLRQERALALLQEMEDEAPQVSSELAQMSFEELADYLEFDPMAYLPGGEEHGERVFIRTKCAACHVFGAIGNGGGPDLSTVTSRFRRRDILESIMYPSKIISDQYVGVAVELADFSSVSGMVVNEDDEVLTLITATGERAEIQKDQIVKRSESKDSIMPEELLNAMTLGDLVNLIKFLEKGADTE